MHMSAWLFVYVYVRVREYAPCVYVGSIEDDGPLDGRSETSCRFIER